MKNIKSNKKNRDYINFSFETFKEIGFYEKNNLTSENPSCFNGIVNLRKYKVTIELIEEPDEIIQERLQKLWDECNNHHNWQPLKNMAKQIGYELKGDPGNLIK